MSRSAMNGEVDRRRPYFKEQFLYAVEKLERAEILRRAHKRKTKELLLQEKGPYAKLRQYAVEYSYATDVHGVSYLIERRSLCERIFWSCVVCAALVACVFACIVELTEFKNVSIIVSYDWHDTPLYEVDFPAVTVCSTARFTKEFVTLQEVRDFYIKQRAPPKEWWLAAQYWYLLCDPGLTSMKYGNKTLTQEEFFSYLEKVRVPVNDIFLRCELFGKRYNCSDLFSPIITEDGVCYTFNLITREQLYEDDVSYHGDLYKTGVSKLKKTLFSGTENDFRITLKSAKKVESVISLCRSFHEGYKVLLHSPLSIPRPSRHHFLLPMNKFVAAAIEPRVVETQKRVLEMPLSKRQCYLPEEKKLDFFKIYNVENCRLECLAKLTLKKCECVQFYVPRSKNTPICGSKRNHCLRKVEKTLERLEMESEFEYCSCKPLCKEVEYEFTTSQSFWNWEGYYEDMWGSDTEEEKTKFNVSMDELSMLSIYFKSPMFRAIKKYEWRGVHDLISSIGGYLSFFTGMSIVSVLEVVYFLSLRIVCNFIKHGTWSGFK